MESERPPPPSTRFPLAAYVWKLKRDPSMFASGWVRRYYVVEKRTARDGSALSYLAYYENDKAACNVNSARDCVPLHEIIYVTPLALAPDLLNRHTAHASPLHDRVKRELLLHGDLTVEIGTPATTYHVRFDTRSSMLQFTATLQRLAALPVTVMTAESTGGTSAPLPAMLEDVVRSRVVGGTLSPSLRAELRGNAGGSSSSAGPLHAAALQSTLSIAVPPPRSDTVAVPSPESNVSGAPGPNSHHRLDVGHISVGAASEAATASPRSVHGPLRLPIPQLASDTRPSGPSFGSGGSSGSVSTRSVVVDGSKSDVSTVHEQQRSQAQSQQQLKRKEGKHHPPVAAPAVATSSRGAEVTLPTQLTSHRVELVLEGDHEIEEGSAPSSPRSLESSKRAPAAAAAAAAVTTLPSFSSRRAFLPALEELEASMTSQRTVGGRASTLTGPPDGTSSVASSRTVGSGVFSASGGSLTTGGAGGSARRHGESDAPVGAATQITPMLVLPDPFIEGPRRTGESGQQRRRSSRLSDEARESIQSEFGRECGRGSDAIPPALPPPLQSSSSSRSLVPISAPSLQSSSSRSLVPLPLPEGGAVFRTASASDVARSRQKFIETVIGLSGGDTPVSQKTLGGMRRDPFRAASSARSMTTSVAESEDSATSSVLTSYVTTPQTDDGGVTPCADHAAADPAAVGTSGGGVSGGGVGGGAPCSSSSNKTGARRGAPVHSNDSGSGAAQQSTSLRKPGSAATTAAAAPGVPSVSPAAHRRGSSDLRAGSAAHISKSVSPAAATSPSGRRISPADFDTWEVERMLTPRMAAETAAAPVMAPSSASSSLIHQVHKQQLQQLQQHKPPVPRQQQHPQHSPSSVLSNTLKPVQVSSPPSKRRGSSDVAAAAESPQVRPSTAGVNCSSSSGGVLSSSNAAVPPSSNIAPDAVGRPPRRVPHAGAMAPTVSTLARSTTAGAAPTVAGAGGGSRTAVAAVVVTGLRTTVCRTAPVSSGGGGGSSSSIARGTAPLVATLSPSAGSSPSDALTGGAQGPSIAAARSARG